MPDTHDVPRPSAAEALKAGSRGLRGTLAEQLASPAPAFDEAAYQLLKFHGVYEGYDRDSATARKQQGLDKEWECMVRARIPAGRLAPEQWLALDRLADRYANGTLRITTRQSIQFHGVLKGNLKAHIRAINDAMLTTIAACGDVVRNVMATPAPIADDRHHLLQQAATALSVALTPRTTAYHEIWLDGALVAGGEEEATDPLYRDTYLPRKFKIGLATPEDNWVDVLSNDLGIIGLFEGDRLVGWNLAVGGGHGMTHNKPRTYPRLASPVVFVPPDELIEAARAVVILQRDHGDRSDRKHARLKYLVDERGLPWVKAELEAILGRPLEDARPMPRFQVVDHMGWHEQGDGRLYLGLPVASGRVQGSLRAALRSVIERFRPTPILTPTQDMILADVRPAERAGIEDVLRAHGVRLPAEQPAVERWAIACPALPTCGLALNEAERIRDPLIADIAGALERAGIPEARLSVRITGCPNGCARPYAGDIGIVGRTAKEYAVFLGGDFEGTQLNRLWKDRVRLDTIAGELEPLFHAYAAGREGAEGFGEWCRRTGVV